MVVDDIGIRTATMTETRKRTRPQPEETYRMRIFENYAVDFEDSGERFDEAAELRWGRAYHSYFEGWLPGSRDASIADLGCGRGRLLYFFRHQGFVRLYGVDASPSQVRLARQVVPEVVQGDVFDFLEQSEGGFDLVAALDLIEHLRKDAVLDFLDLCHARLKPGGRLILQTPNADSPWVSGVRYGDFTHEICFSPPLLARLLRLCGFVDIEARETGPVAWGYSAASTVRFALWQGIRALLRLWNLVETGEPGSGVLTRVFVISGCKR
jgi:2-polyprenyl-3-methyl-5-hydroxy-6-metoxy-1,4-benzoquinol methylase